MNRIGFRFDFNHLRISRSGSGTRTCLLVVAFAASSTFLFILGTLVGNDILVATALGRVVIIIRVASTEDCEKVGLCIHVYDDNDE